VSRFNFCYAEFHYSECRWASYYMAVLASAARTTITRNNIDYTTPKEPRQVQLVCFGYRRGKLRQWKHYLIKFMHSNGLKVYLHVQFCDANLPSGTYPYNWKCIGLKLCNPPKEKTHCKIERVNGS